MIGDRTCVRKLRDQAVPGAVVNESLGRKRRDVRIWRVGGVTEDLPQMGVCGERAVDVIDAGWCERADEDAFVDGFEQPRERVCTGLRSDGSRRFRDGSW